jgi:two-component system, NtrC family, sensor kinase
MDDRSKCETSYNLDSLSLIRNSALRRFFKNTTTLKWWTIPALLLMVLSLLGGMIWRNFDRLETMRAYVIYAHRIQAVAADIQSALTDYFLADNRALQEQQLARLTAEIFGLASNDHHVAPETPLKLQDLRLAITELTASKATHDLQEPQLLKALSITNAIMDGETLNREVMLEDISHSTRTEIILVFATVLGLLALMGLFFRYRILSPLNDLRQLLLRLAKEDYSPIDTGGIDRVLLPTFASYNVMVRHLAELEDTKREYAQSLEAEVRLATHALMEQQAGLSRNEKLAAVGELAAGIAHELRNPLAGIQMSCVNLQHEFSDPDKIQRMSLVIDELTRMAKLLSELLDLSKHTPAPVLEFDVPDLIKDLIRLLRYQIPASTKLSLECPPELRCRLPESRIRQCLLNLVLNGAEAIGAEGGTIAIKVEAPKDEWFSILVMDDGPGFSDAMLENGIRPFSTGKTAGTGLGLAMVQRFVRELGGQLTLANQQPLGAVVLLRLPITTA